MIDIFVNIGVEARRHVNAGLTKDSRARLLDWTFYGAVTLKDHDDIILTTPSCSLKRFQHEKSKKKRDLTVAFNSTRSKPKKTKPSQPADSMEVGEDEIGIRAESEDIDGSLYNNMAPKSL